MKKTSLIFVLLSLVLSAAMLAGCENIPSEAVTQYAAAAQNIQSVVPGLTPAVSAEQAKAVALQDAGISESDAVFVKTCLDLDDGRLLYDVEFYSGNLEYDYDIDAMTGAILSKDQDFETVSSAVNALISGVTPAISEEQARSIALQNAGLAEDQVVFIKSGLDLDDGRLLYEVEFISGINEYDYDIDAQTGAILSMDQDIEYDLSVFLNNPQPAAAAPAAPASASGPVSQDQALQIALQHAGVTKNQISRLKVKQDYDDGRQVYEIEFHVGRTEYEYDIEVGTGNIVDFDMDKD